MRSLVLTRLTAGLVVFAFGFNACGSRSQPDPDVQPAPSPPSNPSPPVSNQAWFATSKYGVAVGFLPRGGANPIPAKTDGTWDTTVQHFDVKRFASDVEKTGAAYVFFSVGQNSGFYVSPSSVFTTKTGTQPGQYVPKERDLILRHVSDRGGVVTVDLGIQANGALIQEQVDAMVRVKRVVRERQPISTNINLALYKTVRMMSNKGDYELPYNGDTFEHFTVYAVDGLRNDRNALASLEYPWSLLVDLDARTAFSRVVVTFPTERYPTDFDLEVSDDAVSWRKVFHGNPTEGGRSRSSSRRRPRVTCG